MFDNRKYICIREQTYLFYFQDSFNGNIIKGSKIPFGFTQKKKNL